MEYLLFYQRPHIRHNSRYRSKYMEAVISPARNPGSTPVGMMQLDSFYLQKVHSHQAKAKARTIM